MKYLLFLLTVWQSVLFCTGAEKADSLLNLIKNSSYEEALPYEELLIKWMYISSYDTAKALSDKLLREAPGLNNNSLYIKTLIHSYRFYQFDEKIKLLNRAEELALKENIPDLLSAAYTFKSIAFRDNSMTDSAMTYALMAMDVAQGEEVIEDIRSVSQLIADMHFYAGQYQEAEETYRNILAENLKKNNVRANLTVISNIGLIRVKQKKYAEAEEYFRRALDLLTSEKMTYADSSGMVYLFRKLLEVAVAQKEFQKAEEYFQIAESGGIRFQQHTEMPGIYAAKGAICYGKSDYDSALYYYKKAEALDRISPDISFQVTIYGGLADTYLAKKDNSSANRYLLLLLDARSKADSAFHRSRYMNIYAEHNYKYYRKEIANFKSRQELFIIIISFISLSLVIGIFSYLRLNALNKKLVQKNIEAVEGYKSFQSRQAFPAPETQEPSDESEPAETLSDVESSVRTTHEVDEEKLRALIRNLEALMENEKLYLDPELSLGAVAERLGSNRTYLSKAINAAYKDNFNSYINDLRVKEVIHHITSGEIHHLNMEGLARQCGFSNRVTLTRAFQKFTGVSPSFFIKNAGRV